METYRILCLNFGSTSTKMAVFENEKEVWSKNFTPGTEEYPKFKTIKEHQAFAKELIPKELGKLGLTLEDIDVFAARGGAQVFIESGAYAINQQMFDDTDKFGGDSHPGKLATRICFEYGRDYHKPALMINGPSVDEYQDVARMTGLPEIYRQSRIHALNQKEVCYRYAASVNRKYEDMNLLVLHLGGGISVTAHDHGKMIDSNDIIEGEGPMTPTRAGALPTLPLLRLAYSGEYPDFPSLMLKLIKRGGLTAHLGTDDVREVEKMIRGGDEYAKMVLDTMVYQIAKTAGEMAVALKGKVDQIIYTGGIAKGNYVTDGLDEYLGWIAPSTKIPGEFEMEALASGCMRVLNGKEKAKTYTGVDVWTGFGDLPGAEKHLHSVK